MNRFSAGTRIASAFFAAVAVVVVGFGAFLHAESRKADERIAAAGERIAALEHHLAAIATALKDSESVSEKNREEIQELANRGQVIARSQEELLTEAVSKASPAVVSLVISKDVPKLEVAYVNPFGDDPYFRDFGIRVPVYRQVGTEHTQVGAGTGFLVRADGYILTNRHVVYDQQAEYTALLSSGQQRSARVIYRDDALDIALLKIEGSGYPTVSLGRSSALKLGQTVVAIGNALGEYSNSVSVGIISGLDRTIQAQDEQGRVETLSGIIQTDAAINRGNSGGPLLDLSGNAVGVNVAMASGASNIAFAIPADAVRSILARVLP